MEESGSIEALSVLLVLEKSFWAGRDIVIKIEIQSRKPYCGQ